MLRYNGNSWTPQKIPADSLRLWCKASPGYIPGTSQNWLFINNDVVINGGFDADSDWNKGSRWTISGGSANITSGAFDEMHQDGILEIGSTYRLIVVVSVCSGAGIWFKLGGAQSSGVTAPGTYSYLIKCASNTNLYIDSAANTVASVDSISCIKVNIATWYDGSGNGNNFIQTTASAQPVWSATGSKNSKGCIQFNGISQFMKADNIGISNPALIVAVVKWTTTGVNNEQQLWDGDTTASAMLGWSVANGGFKIYQGSGLAFTRNPTSTGTYIFESLFNTSNSGCSMNGETRATGWIGGTYPAGITLARLGGSASYWGKIDVSEIIVMNRDFLGTERQDLIHYLTRQWGSMT